MGSWFRRKCLARFAPGLIRPFRLPYEVLLEIVTLGRGLPRLVNDDLEIRVCPAHRSVGGEYEVALYNQMKSSLKEGDIVLDVGAHVGIFSVMLARCVGMTGKVFAFEPSPASQKLFRRHMRLNEVDRQVELIPAAVGNRSGHAILHAWGSHVGNTLAARDPIAGGTGYKEVSVQVLTLDQFCKDRGILPKWVKVDTEGWELRVLQGAKLLLGQGEAVNFAVEMHPYAWLGAGYNRLEFETFCKDFGIRVKPLTEQADPFEEYGNTIFEIKSAHNPQQTQVPDLR